MTDSERIAKLEARIAKLEARLAELDSRTISQRRFGPIHVPLPESPSLDLSRFRPPPAPMLGDDSVHPSQTHELPTVHC